MAALCLTTSSLSFNSAPQNMRTDTGKIKLKLDAQVFCSGHFIEVRVVAVSTDLAPDSAFAPSFLGRSSGQLPAPIVCCPLFGHQVKSVDTVPMVWPLIRLPMGTAMVIAQPAPFVSAFIDAVDQAIREQSPSHGMSAMQRAWLAFCVTAVLVTNSICWARGIRLRRDS